MYDKNGNIFYEITNQHESNYIKIDEINDYTINAFVAIEDKRFFKHHGFDIYSISRAFFHNLFHKDKIGGSTITQQYVKNIYFSNKKSLIRKIREIYYAIKIDSIYTKEEILEGYLNTIYFSHGIYGIKDAAKYYFNKEVKDLTIAESASLVAIIKSPTKYNPETNYLNNKKRKENILKELLKQNLISKIEYIDAVNEEIIITKTNYQTYSPGVLYYKDLVLSQIKKMAINSRNIEVYTNFDSDLNKLIDKEIASSNLTSDISVIVIDHKGNLLCSYGNKEYSKKQINIGVYGKRMIGSTIKPMLYYEALNNNMDVLTKFMSNDSPMYIGNTKYDFKNYGNKYENDKITMAYALATSDNIYAVKTHLYIGSDKLIKFLKSFKIKNIDDYPSLALGTVNMSLLKLTTIYNTFSRLGEYSDPKIINRITTNNKDLYINKEAPAQKLAKNRTFVINELMTGMFDVNMSNKISVTGSNIAKDMVSKCSAKSGLTDYDSYMVGFSPLITIGIWCGYEDNSLLLDSYNKSYPKILFKTIFNEKMKENKNIWYQKPNDVYKVFTSPTGLNSSYKKNMYFIY